MIILSEVSLATNGQLFAEFILCQLTFLVAYKYFMMGSNSKLPWILLLLVCLTYIWDTDYYSYMIDYVNGLETTGNKEKLYYYLCQITTPYYIIFRLIIWGTAILLYYHTCKRLEIQPYVGIYVLICFFLTLFAYGRVNLAMTLYYCGFSYLIKPGNNKLLSYIFGITVLSSSFFAHRSFLPVIVITPLFFIPLNKGTISLLFLSTPLITLAIKYLFSGFLNESIQMDSSFESFQSSAERAVNSGFEERNWKSLAMIAVRNYSFYIPCIYILFKLFISRSRIYIEEYLKPLVMCISVIIIISICLQYGLDSFETGTMAKRYLFMSGIGECLLLSNLYTNCNINESILNRLIFLGFAVMEGNFLITYALHGYNIQ